GWCCHALFALALATLRLVHIAPRCSLGMDAKYHDPRAFFPGSRLVSLLERHVPDRARLANDGWRIGKFNDGITFQVVVELLSGVPVPAQLLVGRNLDEIDDDFAVGRKLR